MTDDAGNHPAGAPRILVEAALSARERAYAPYSRFRVGAAVLTAEGEVFRGCNVENAAYPEGTCAEAGAIAAMIAGGGREIRLVAVAGSGPAPCVPCGGCRQKIREFATPLTRVLVAGETGEVLLDEAFEALLPRSFGPENL